MNMRNGRSILSALAFCAALAGCLCDGGSSAYAHLDRSDSLAGVDADNNGIRDDIDAYIAKQPYAADPKKRAAVQQMARAMQNTVLVDKTDMMAVREVDRQEGYAVLCLSRRFDPNKGDPYPDQIGAEIEAITANTKQRLKAYLAFSAALDGTVWTLPKGDTCDE